MRWMFGLMAASIACSAAAAEERYRIDPDHTFVHFAVLHTGVSSVHGRFSVTGGRATFDPATETAAFSVEINPGSVDTGVKKLDAALAGEQFLDVARFRTARVSGRATRFAEGVPVEFAAELTVKGTTIPVTLSAERFTCREVTVLVIKHYVCGGDLNATIKRSALGISKYLSMVSDEVRLAISVEAVREGP